MTVWIGLLFKPEYDRLFPGIMVCRGLPPHSSPGVERHFGAARQLNKNSPDLHCADIVVIPDLVLKRLSDTSSTRFREECSDPFQGPCMLTPPCKPQARFLKPSLYDLAPLLPSRVAPPSCRRPAAEADYLTLRLALSVDER